MLVCWHCCHDFEGIHIEMPYSHDERRDTFVTKGRFCSWSCCKTYALEKYGVNKGSIICGNMIMMRKKLYGKLGQIKPAPKRERLKIFGGSLDIEEFRQNLLVDKEKPNEIQMKSYQNNIIQNTTNTNKLLEIKKTKGQNEPLRLKREKPLKRDQNNLESVLGLIIKPSNN